MLVAIIGSSKSGKKVLAQHLVSTHSFVLITIHSPSPSNNNIEGELHFASSSECLDHVTQNYDKDFVTVDLRDRTKLREFEKRPFVAVLAVEAPLGVRYSRAVIQARERQEEAPTLEEFVREDDEAIYGSTPPSLTTSSNGYLETPTKMPQSGPAPSPLPSPHLPSLTPNPTSSPLVHLLPLAHLTLSNPSSKPISFVSQLSLSHLRSLLRPPWDAYFMKLATLASLRSNCMKRRVGAVLVREKRVVSTGYNGTPRGVRNCNEGGCRRCNSSMNKVGVKLDECLCLHAEENALLEAGRERVSGGGTKGAVLYCNTCPCLRCTVKIVQSGVTEVVYSLSYSMDDASREVLSEAGVVLRQMELPDL